METMHYDIAQTLVDALKLIGCDPSKIGRIDRHSPIELTFHASPSIIIEMINDDCGIHAVVASDEGARLHRANSERLLQLLIEPAGWATTGHVQLRADDTRLVLHALFRQDTVANAEPLAHALTDFYDRIKQCREHLTA
ncbi:Surface presentation of antigens protein SpaK [Pandoraea terrae]|uniref:Surface presentation of antigens protein SpaK n=1 Tax=Pandoraea terrae TaxID=1537710 RepID=A0A5E4ZFV3_9BURK|nr:hypothetical protein [Pandoraea terrae]VVE59180.1 Surface presentation of antigens protein SpaK [Pandoraea terrae]